jgi:hypothetical protein
MPPFWRPMLTGPLSCMTQASALTAAACANSDRPSAPPNLANGGGLANGWLAFGQGGCMVPKIAARSLPVSPENTLKKTASPAS